jgi:ABC-type glycerol-3-phosphate transport system substrate-binding protein
MKMMKKHTYIYLALAGLTLAACSTQDTMSDADKTPIALNASMEGANASVSSRVDTYSAMATGARVYMQVSGTWNSNTVSDKTSATANAASGTTNALTFEAPIY